MFKIFCTYICGIIYKMQHLEVSGALRHIYIYIYIYIYVVQQLRVNINTGILLEMNYPITGLKRPFGFRRLRLPELLENQHMKVVRLSVLCTGHLYPQGDTPGPQCSRKVQVNGK